MESKSTSCVVTSLAIAFVVMLAVAALAHGALTAAGGDIEKGFALPGTDLGAATVAVWGLVAGAGAVAKTGASYLLTHLHR